MHFQETWYGRTGAMLFDLSPSSYFSFNYCQYYQHRVPERCAV
jgi:hypothetical protein